MLRPFIAAIIILLWPILASGKEAYSLKPLQSDPPSLTALPPPDLQGATLIAADKQSVLLGGITSPAGSLTPQFVTSARLFSATGITEIPLNLPRAFAAGIAYKNQLLLISGQSPTGPTPDVTSITLQPNAPAIISQLPPLPRPMLAPAVAILNDHLYVYDSTPPSTPSTPSSPSSSDLPLFFSLDLTSPSATWLTLPNPPLAPSSSPVLLAAQYQGIHLFASSPSSDSVQALVYLPQPREATTHMGWQKLPSLPIPGSLLSALPTGQQAITLLYTSSASQQTQALLFNAISLGTSPLVLPALPAPSASPLLIAPGYSRFALLLPTGPADLSPTKLEKSLSWIDFVVIALYFIIMAAIGFAFSAKQTSTEAFSLGGRDVQWWAAGLSMFATAVSSISFIAIPALTYKTNLIYFTPLIVMIPAFFIQGWLIFPLLAKLKITSTFEYLEQRFNIPLRLIASAQAIIFQTVGRTGIVLLLPSIALAATTGLDVITCVIVMGVVTTLYTALGGFEAVIWTDVVQGLLMFAAPLLVILVVLYKLPGGVSQAYSVLDEGNRFQFALPTWEITLPALWILLLGNILAHTIQIAGDQPVIQRVFSSPLKTIRKTSAMYIACGLIIGTMVNAMGLALYAYFNAFPAELDLAAVNDQVVPYFLITSLPTGLAGLLIAAIFAAAMSTVSSSMNSVATLIHVDFYKRLFPHASEKTQLRFLKNTSYVIGLIGTGFACLIATLNIDSMMVTWNLLISLLSGGVVGVYSLGMFTKRANSFGAIVGALSSIVYTLWAMNFTSFHWSTHTPFALIVCIIVGYVVSLLTGGTRKDLTGLTTFTPAPTPPPIPPK